MRLASPDADPRAIHAHAVALREAAGSLEELVDLATQHPPEGWSGMAATAYAATARTLAHEADRAASDLRRLARRVDDHGAAMSALVQRRAALEVAEASAAEVRGWEHDLAVEEDGMREAFAVAGTPIVRGAVTSARPSRPARRRTNGSRLAEDLERLTALARERELTAPEEQHLRIARATRAALDRIGSTPDPVTGRPVTAHLHVYDPTAFDGDGRVVVAAGDIGTAADVAVVVPGLHTDAADVGVQAERALRIHLAARRLDPGAGNATLAWIGYDAPDNLPVVGDGDVTGVLTQRLARRGADELSETVATLRAAGDPHLTVIGYSYGSTVAGLAASGPGLATDDLVLVGSPGVGDTTGSVSDTGIDPRHVWVLRNSHDPVARLGDEGWMHAGALGLGLGPDPATDDWGATRLRAESSTRGEAGPWGEHATYFDPGGEALANLAHVVSGELHGVRTAPAVHDPWWGPPLDPELRRHPAGPVARPVR